MTAFAGSFYNNHCVTQTLDESPYERNRREILEVKNKKLDALKTLADTVHEIAKAINKVDLI